MGLLLYFTLFLGPQWGYNRGMPYRKSPDSRNEDKGFAELKVRLPNQLAELVRESAEKNHRSVNSEILFVLTQHLNQTLNEVATSRSRAAAIAPQRYRPVEGTSRDQQDDVALQEYLHNMRDLIDNNNLMGAREGNEIINVAQAMTKRVLEEISGRRKASVVQFLNKSRLINVNKPIVSMVRVDLTLASLSHNDLSKVNLRGADLRRADLREADLTEADLTGANLTEADLTEANLTGADLTEANLARARLTMARLTMARLMKVQLSLANLSRADLRRADLREADLTGANLTAANLTGADLTGAKSPVAAPGPR